MKPMFSFVFVLLTTFCHAQTASRLIDQNLVFQFLDDEGRRLTVEKIDKFLIEARTDSTENLISQHFDKEGKLSIVRKAVRFYGDYNFIMPTNLTVVYFYKKKKMTLRIQNISTASLKILKIPFKAGDFSIHLQKESDFVKSQQIEITDWASSKVVFKKIK